LLLVNTSLVIFNLLPAFPMDGGRIFRAFLALFMDYAQATRIAASVGQLMAIIFVFVGLSGNTMLLFIAFFVWLGASSEATSVEQRVLLKSSLVRDAMLVNYETVNDNATIESVIQLLLKGSQSEFPVHQALTGEPLGVLSRNIILSSLAEKGPEGLVRECPLDKLGQEKGSRSLVAVAQHMRENGQTCLEVTDDSGQIIGLLTQDNLAEFIMVQSALKYRET
jgi:CBS domain-containing protein